MRVFQKYLYHIIINEVFLNDCFLISLGLYVFNFIHGHVYYRIKSEIEEMSVTYRVSHQNRPARYLAWST